jgi:hypothetical protein
MESGIDKVVSLKAMEDFFERIPEMNFVRIFHKKKSRLENGGMKLFFRNEIILRSA